MNAHTPSSKDISLSKHQNIALSPTTLMIYYFAHLARSFMKMVEILSQILPSYDQDSDPYRQLFALYSESLLIVNEWNLDIGEKSFACVIPQACEFIEKLLNIVQENIEHLTDIELCELCKETEADIQLTILEGKLADFDRNNEDIDDAERTALAAELKAQVQILASCQVALKEWQAAIETLQNYVTELKNSRMYKLLYALAEKKIGKKKQDNDTLAPWQVVKTINDTKRKIDRTESLSAAEKRQRMRPAEKINFER